jgi:hypothetical protein
VVFGVALPIFACGSESSQTAKSNGTGGRGRTGGDGGTGAAPMGGTSGAGRGGAGAGLGGDSGEGGQTGDSGESGDSGSGGDAGDPSGGSAGSGGTAGSGGGAGATGRCDDGSSDVIGLVNDDQGGAIPAARVTLVDASDAFWEVRTDSNGRYALAGVSQGTYELGVSALGKAFVGRTIDVSTECIEEDFALTPETERGQWQSFGSPGEIFGGTNSGVLLPDGRVMYCHDTLDPVILDPVAMVPARAASSSRLQGCHGVTVLHDGRVLYVGGADQPVYGPGTRQVKTFNATQNQWTPQPQLNDGRWYPTLVPLPDGQVLAAGGGGVDNPVRVNTSEVLNPSTMQWTPVGNISIGNEVSPIVLLFTGEVLMTHRPPQLYNPSSQTWRASADFVQANRMSNGDHADHEMVLLPNGEVVAIGYMSFSSGNDGNLVEIYDPSANEWRLGANFAPVRSRASIIQLPNQKILTLGGFKEQESDATPVNAWGQVALADEYDPRENRWRRLANMTVAREYHAMPILVPDGRVFITGGEGQPGNEPSANVVEAFSPPYLFRGPRPVISALSSASLRRGETFSFEVSKTNAPTSVILMGSVATTHFMDSGNGRFLELEFTQRENVITATVPASANRSAYGYYILFTMVDDIPSVGRMVRIAP